MKKTFKELVAELHKSPLRGYDFCITDEEIIKLLQLVKEKTLEEAANNAEASCTIINDAWDIKPDDIEVYVINSSILNLDKNSIEL